MLKFRSFLLLLGSGLLFCAAGCSCRISSAQIPSREDRETLFTQRIKTYQDLFQNGLINLEERIFRIDEIPARLEKMKRRMEALREKMEHSEHFKLKNDISRRIQKLERELADFEKYHGLFLD